MTNHINYLVKTCFYHLRRIKAIRHCLPTSSAIKLVNSFIISRVDYCNGLLAGATMQQFDKIQSILNAAARIIYGKTKSDHITSLMRDNLHWLRAPQRVMFKICLTMFKANNGLAPSYLTDFCIPPASKSTYPLRSADQNRLLVPRTKTKFGEQAFNVIGPSLWNSLPNTIVRVQSLETFKKRLKTYLFKMCYD